MLLRLRQNTWWPLSSNVLASNLFNNILEVPDSILTTSFVWFQLLLDHPSTRIVPLPHSCTFVLFASLSWSEGCRSIVSLEPTDYAFYFISPSQLLPMATFLINKVMVDGQFGYPIAYFSFPLGFSMESLSRPSIDNSACEHLLPLESVISLSSFFL